MRRRLPVASVGDFSDSSPGGASGGVVSDSSPGGVFIYLLHAR